MDFISKVREFDRKEKELSSASGGNTLNDEQAYVFKSVLQTYKDGGMAFLQGSGGSGKSVTINALKKYCDSRGISCVVTASTGKAASALNGKTIHSYIGLSMRENENAESVDEAFKLKSSEKEVELPDILIIDEASMIGQSLLNEIMKVGFKYILFVGDLSQLRPVKDKAVDWDTIVNWKYELKRNMRARDERIVEVFNHFREYKEGYRDSINIFDYVNGDNIVEMDYIDVQKLSSDTEATFIGYRNKLVEKFALKLKADDNTRYNLNVGVTVTKMVVPKGEEPDDNGYFKREFINEQVLYNGEDVTIVKLTDVTQRLVNNGYAMYGKWRLKLSNKGIIINDTTAPVEHSASESRAPKYWISFPPDEVLEYTTLSIINDEIFALVWDGVESEFKEMEEYYFNELYPYLRKIQTIKAYFRGKDVDFSILDSDVRASLNTMSQYEFMNWYEFHGDTVNRRKGWSELYAAKSVVSARPAVARTCVKAQGISVNSIIICKDSFYGADKAAAYVTVSRAKHGIILLKNVPDDWKK